MAHRYASRVAENTCSVKRSEADAELALLEAREAAFIRWLSDYKTATRNSAASFTAMTGAASGPAAVETWQSAYKTAYDTAFTQATGHMSGTAWNSFDWRYEATTLNWGGYAEVFAVRVQLADRPPVLCHTTLPAGRLLASNKAAAGGDALTNVALRDENGNIVWRSAAASGTTVWRPSGWAGSGSGWAVFDDTAHSAMTNGSLRRLSGETGILSSRIFP